MMGNLLAVSDKATDPTAWAETIKAVGFPAVVAILCVGGLIFVIYMALRWTLGDNGWLRPLVTKFFDDLADKLNQSEAAEVKQYTLCMEMRDAHMKPGGVANLADIREGGKVALDGLAALSGDNHEAKAKFLEAKSLIGRAPIQNS